MQQAVEIALDHGRAGGAERITKVLLKVGSLSGVEPDALRFAFDVVVRGTIAEGADLQIEHQAGFDLQVASIEVV
jgi:hydrogenase nickel incorporation protein HypA/HybF